MALSHTRAWCALPPATVTRLPLTRPFQDPSMRPRSSAHDCTTVPPQLHIHHSRSPSHAHPLTASDRPKPASKQPHKPTLYSTLIPDAAIPTSIRTWSPRQRPFHRMCGPQMYHSHKTSAIFLLDGHPCARVPKSPRHPVLASSSLNTLHSMPTARHPRRPRPPTSPAAPQYRSVDSR